MTDRDVDSKMMSSRLRPDAVLIPLEDIARMIAEMNVSTKERFKQSVVWSRNPGVLL